MRKTCCTIFFLALTAVQVPTGPAAAQQPAQEEPDEGPNFTQVLKAGEEIIEALKRPAELDRSIAEILEEIKKRYSQEDWDQALRNNVAANKKLREGFGELPPDQRQPDSPEQKKFKRNLLAYAKQTDPSNPEYLAESGHEHLRAREYDDAFRNLGLAIKNGVRNPQTFTGYGVAAHNLGDNQLAAASAAIALNMNASYLPAFTLLKLSRGRGSSAHLDSVLASPDLALPDEEDQAGRGGAKDFSNGGSPPSRALASAIAQSAAFTREAAHALQVKDYPAAHVLATTAIEKNRSNAQAWNYRAIADNKLNRFEAAAADAGMALSLAPGSTPALQSRAWAFSKQGKYQAALADAGAILKLEPENPFAYQNRAFALAGAGDREGMLESLRRSAQLDPRFQKRYEHALQVPRNDDVLFLFDDAPAAALVSKTSPELRKRRFIRLSIWVVLGGGLVGLGFLHVFSAAWRETVRATARRFIGEGAPSAAAHPPSGNFRGQYELIRELGTGGMGVVYEAKDVALERSVAIKRMREEIRANPKERARFMAEAKIVAALHHPHIVDIYSVVDDGDEAYLVFEYVKGKTLAEVLDAKECLDYEAARRIISCAARAVDYAHKHKVIHRDLKPSNIMVTEDGAAKVMDFGVARQAQEALSKLAMTNTVVGTPAYMAPEQERGLARPESDIFALTAIFYEALSGQRPFAGLGAGLLLNKINGKYIPISNVLHDGLPAGLDQVLSKGLAADPEQRFPGALELVQALENLGHPRLV